jgi:small subunit ribosomal protein S20
VANTKSAEKRMRQAAIRNERNSAIRSTVKTAVKKVREAVAKGDNAAATTLLAKATKTIDQAAAKGVLKSSGASRKVSRLAKAVNGASAAQEAPVGTPGYEMAEQPCCIRRSRSCRAPRGSGSALSFRLLRLPDPRAELRRRARQQAQREPPQRLPARGLDAEEVRGREEVLAAPELPHAEHPSLLHHRKAQAGGDPVHAHVAAVRPGGCRRRLERQDRPLHARRRRRSADLTRPRQRGDERLREERARLRFGGAVDEDGHVDLLHAVGEPGPPDGESVAAAAERGGEHRRQHHLSQSV